MGNNEQHEQQNFSDKHRDATIVWLTDRSNFHTWFTTLIVGSFMVLTVFGNKPGFENISELFLSICLILLLVSMLCNLVCVWSIPGWKYRIQTGIVNNTKNMHRDLSITAWIGVICFVSGLTIGFIGNLPV